jgi:large subunit ribosomal protein L20
MPRVKRGTQIRKKRKKLFSQTKGYRHGRKNVYRQAKQAILKAKTNEYRDRRTKKRDFRRIWIVRINAACRDNGIKYSEFIKKLQDKKIDLDRKVLADLAVNNPDEFKKIVDKVK